MSGVFKPTKKRVIIAAAIVVIVAVAIVLPIYFHHRAVEHRRSTMKLSSAIKDIKNPGTSTSPSTETTKALNAFAADSTNPVEQAKAYDSLAYAYKDQAKYSDALDAFQKEKFIATAAKLTKEQVAMIDLQIQLMQLQIKSSGDFKNGAGGYAEPAQ